MTSRRLAALCAATILALACSDATDVQSATDAGPNADVPVGGDTGTNNNPPPVGARELRQPDNRLDYLVFHDQTVDLVVEYVGSTGGIPNANVTATLLTEQGQDSGGNVEGSVLQSQRVSTDASGRAIFTLQAGARDASMKVRISAQDAADLTFTVTVGREGAGALAVRVTYDTNGGRYAYADFAQARVFLFDRDNCATLATQAADLGGAYFELPAISPFNEVDNATSARDLDDGVSFQVAAVAENEAGGVIAFGCLDGVSVIGGDVRSIEVPLGDLDLEFKGVYSVVHRFDLTDILANSENSTLATVARVLEVLQIVGDGGERGDALVSLFCDIANISEGTCNLIDGVGARLINEVIERTVPENVLRVFTILSDVISIFSDLTVVGEIQLESVAGDGRIPGNDNRWQKFRWTWRDGCPAGENCTREFALGDLQVDDRPIYGTFDAALEGATLRIESHSVNFRYGLIILEMAQNWLLPRLLDPPSNQRVTVEEMLGAILPCAAINEGLTGDANDDICEQVLVASLAEIIVDQIGALEFAADEFTIEGTVIPVDSDGDLVIDQLSMGQWSGSVAISDPPFAFQGCFEGCRPGAEPCEPAACNP